MRGRARPGPDRRGSEGLRGEPGARGRERRRLTQLDARPDARSALEAWIREYGTIEEAAASHSEAETLTGRGRVFVVPAPVRTHRSGSGVVGAGDPLPAGPERWVVRHYRRGGAIASLLGDRYLRLGTPRPVRELRVGLALESRGLPTPAHIGAAVYPAGPWYRGDLVTRYVPDSRDLAAVLFPGRSLGDGAARHGVREAGADRRAEPTAAMRAAGRLFRRLHHGGVVHPDLNLKNILIRGAGDGLEALVLDLDGARVQDRVGEPARRRMIARFWRSARKWRAATEVELDPGLEAAFRAGYDE